MRLDHTSIPGLLHARLDLHTDDRGWFVECYQQARLRAAGLPDLDVVQHNVSYNERVGVARGVHAEPWDKWVAPVHGQVFAAVVDLRAHGFGAVATFHLGPGQALYVPRGCGNAYCTLAPHTVYSYLVNAHWSPDASYPAVNLLDPALGIPWPLPPDQLVISPRDAAHPPLAQLAPLTVPT